MLDDRSEPVPEEKAAGLNPPPADHTPSGRPRPAPPALRSVPLPLHFASLTSLRSWRLPDLLFLSGLSDDHDRLETRRSSSANSARRAVLRTALLARRGGLVPPLNETPPPGAPRLLPPPRGRAVEGDRPGRRDRPVSLRPGCGRVKGHPPVRGNVEATTCHDTTPTGGRGRLGYQVPKEKRAMFQCEESHPPDETLANLTLPQPGRAGRSSPACRPTIPAP